MWKDPIAVQRFIDLQRQFGFLAAIETGTDQGLSAEGISSTCPCYTIEIEPRHRGIALQEWIKHGFTAYPQNERIDLTNGDKKIFSYLGNSKDLLPRVLAEAPAPVCVFCDAHWGEYWPLLDELRIIAEHKISPVIIIHDFQVPNHPEFGFDNHGGKDLNMDYVRDALNAINPNYNLFYNDRAEGNQRGILYATP